MEFLRGCFPAGLGDPREFFWDCWGNPGILYEGIPGFFLWGNQGILSKIAEGFPRSSGRESQDSLGLLREFWDFLWSNSWDSLSGNSWIFYERIKEFSLELLREFLGFSVWIFCDRIKEFCLTESWDSLWNYWGNSWDSLWGNSWICFLWGYQGILYGIAEGIPGFSMRESQNCL